MGRKRFKIDIFTKDELINFLRDERIEVEKTNFNYKLTSENLSGFIIMKGDYWEDADGICLDNIKCFDKATRCPILYKLPISSEFLRDRMIFLASEEGYRQSNEYDWDDEYFRHPKQ